jgi:colicin import membrane protein
METKTNYELLKEWLKMSKEKFMLAICAILIFIIGFGTGRAEQEFRKNNNIQNNYTTKTPHNKVVDEQRDNLNKSTTDTQPLQSTNQTNQCLIKGTSSKIYHIPGGAFYDRVISPAACFESENDAQTAGYRKSSR